MTAATASFCEHCKTLYGCLAAEALPSLSCESLQALARQARAGLVPAFCNIGRRAFASTCGIAGLDGGFGGATDGVTDGVRLGEIAKLSGVTEGTKL